MKKILSLILIFAAVPLFSQDSFNRYFISASSAARESVVNIIIHKTEKDEPSKIGYGSGTIISSDGYIVTNNHVVSNGTRFQVVLSNGTRLNTKKLQNGRFFMADKKTDLAVIKIDPPAGYEIKPIKFSDSNSISEGEWVIAIGNPYGLRHSITAGIVSSKGRDNIGFTDIEDFIQTDVAINPGNSGGPLVNLKGTMIGVNTAIRTVSGGYQGISFAIPSNIVKQVCNELIRHGRVRRGWLGFMAADSRDTKDAGTVRIISVVKNSPAEKAGLKNGDIITDIDGYRITSTGSLLKKVGEMPVGARINISVKRGSGDTDFTLILREKDEYEKLREDLDVLLSKYGIDVDENSEMRGVVISYISPKIMDLGLRNGDIIIALNGKNISSLDSYVKVLQKSRYKIYSLDIFRDSRVYTVDFEDNTK